MEYGYAFYKTSLSDGCQNDTIRNCTITLSSANNTAGTAPMVDGSTGIITMNATATAATTNLIPTTAAGANSNNSFYGNTIQNCNTGIALIGFVATTPFTPADVNNDVGGTSAATGNTIINYGGGGSTNPAVAIRTLAQYTLNVSNNTINSNNGGGTNHANILRGIYINTAVSANTTVRSNTVTVKGGGTTQAVTAIENVSGSTAASNFVNISDNVITNCSYGTASTGTMTGILNSGGPTLLFIRNNSFTSNSLTASGAGAIVGISSSGAAATARLSNNTFTGASLTSATGTFSAILNSGVVTTLIAIDSNNVGTSGTGVVTFPSANSGAQTFINNVSGSATGSVSLSNNNIQGITYSSASTGANTYITNSFGTLNRSINNNTFSNLNVNTSGSVTFLSDAVILPASGARNVNNNAILTGFNKGGAGGTVTLYSNATTSAAGATSNMNGNNFSNITITGATTMAGWVVTDAGASATVNIQNDTFANWSCGSVAVTAATLALTGTNSISANIINTISASAAVTGIATGTGNDNVFGNTINGLSSTGAVAVSGISVPAGGTTVSIYKNKIYDISNSNATGTVNGIIIAGSTTVKVYNNIIGDLRTPIGNAVDPVRGINITSAVASTSINLYYNTIHLSATSSGTNFGTTGIFHTASATASTAALDMRNNIISNSSTANGTGLIVAFRRSAAALNNYASTSNRNLLYAGPTSAANLIYYDGTNADQTLFAYKARVTTMDANSVSENLAGGSKFMSTTGSSANFLHIDPTKATQAESGGANIATYTDDYDGDIRQGNGGYAGSGSAPDLGADEFNGTALTGLSGTYTVGTAGSYPTLTGVGGLFEDISTRGLSGYVTAQIISDLTESGTNALAKWTESGAGGYTVHIVPSAAAPRLIAGNAVSGLIRLNGADGVTIDGRFGGSGSYLTFRNTNTGGTTGTAITFIEGATTDTIMNCNLEAYADATHGVVYFATSTIAGGNSNNYITACNINGTVSGNTSNVAVIFGRYRR